jgi:teichuronic acid biosynthesis glycosyltransferase TuaC
MRIITFTSLFPDSTRPNFCVFVYQRMAHFARRPGNQVTVVAPVPYVPNWMPGKKAREYRSVPRFEQFGELKVYHPRYPFLPKVGMALHGFLMAIGAFARVRELVNQGTDCIDAHFVYPDGFAAVLMGRMLSVPVIISARGTDINLSPTFVTVRPLLKWALRNAQGLIGVCKALSDAMVELGAESARVQTIGNGVDAKRFHPLDRVRMREQLGLPRDKRVIVAVGGLVRVKGFHILIPAIAELKSRGWRVQLCILGEGDFRPTLEKQIRDLGLHEDVILKGTVPNEQLRYWYSAADISCLASSREGWANVLLESMACGTPVVATRIWGTPEVVASDELGFLVEQNQRAIADGLQSALLRDWNRGRISSYAHQRSWEVVAEEVETWIHQRTGIIRSSNCHGRATGVRA